MKKITLLFLLVISYAGFAQQYLLKDDNTDKNFISNFIAKNIEEGNITSTPLILLNNKTLSEEELDQFNFYRNDIAAMSAFDRDNKKMVEVYGNKAINGVIIIDTESRQKEDEKSIVNSKVLYLVDGKEASDEDIEKLLPDLIDTIQIIKDKKAMTAYNAAHYDRIVLITLKK